MATVPLISDDEASAEALAVIGMAMQTNGIATGLQVPVDDIFKVSH